MRRCEAASGVRQLHDDSEKFMEIDHETVTRRARRHRQLSAPRPHDARRRGVLLPRAAARRRRDCARASSRARGVLDRRSRGGHLSARARCAAAPRAALRLLPSVAGVRSARYASEESRLGAGGRTLLASPPRWCDSPPARDELAAQPLTCVFILIESSTSMLLTDMLDWRVYARAVQGVRLKF